MPLTRGRLALFVLAVQAMQLGCSRHEEPVLAASTGPPSAEKAKLYPQPESLMPGLMRPPSQAGVAIDPIVIPDCRLTPIDRQDVPSQREGVILFIGTEAPGENIEPDRRIDIKIGGESKRFRRLKEDDSVVAGQLLAQLDDRLARDDLAIRVAKLAAARADLAGAEKTRNEAKNRHDTQLRLRATAGAASLEEVRATRLTWERYCYEVESKREAVKLAEREMSQAQTIVDMHQIRSSTTGVVKSIYKRPGEAVKNLEPVFQVCGLARLRAEGWVDVAAFHRLRKGMTVIVEPRRPNEPEQTLFGHFGEVTAVGVSGHREQPRIVSAGEDGTVRVWTRASRYEQRVLTHSSPVRALACSPAGSPQEYCLAGDADGTIDVWELDGGSEKPRQSMEWTHAGGVTSLAVSPNGKICATSGEDREICLGDIETGHLLYRMSGAHRAAITSLQFTPGSGLVSAGRDNTIKVWTLVTDSGQMAASFEGRSGEVGIPGTSPDGRHVLMDQGKKLRIFNLEQRLTEGVIENGPGAGPFSTFALFSPDARLLLTAGSADARVQLWRAPTATTRPYELRELVSRDRSPATCAAFAPDGSFLVVGNKDRQVLVWSIPNLNEVNQQLTGRISLVEQAAESSAHQVRVWADVENPTDASRRLMLGMTVSLAIYPKSERTSLR